MNEPVCTDCGEAMKLARPDGLYLCANLDCIPNDYLKYQFGCLTGDCPHETDDECNAWIRDQLLEQARLVMTLRRQLEAIR